MHFYFHKFFIFLGKVTQIKNDVNPCYVITFPFPWITRQKNEPIKNNFGEEGIQTSDLTSKKNKIPKIASMYIF